MRSFHAYRLNNAYNNYFNINLNLKVCDDGAYSNESDEHYPSTWFSLKVTFRRLVSPSPEIETSLFIGTNRIGFT